MIPLLKFMKLSSEEPPSPSSSTPESELTPKRKLSYKSVSLNQFCSPRKKIENVIYNSTIVETPYLQLPLLDPTSSNPNTPRMTASSTSSEIGIAPREVRWSRRKSEPFFNSWDYGNTLTGSSPMLGLKETKMQKRYCTMQCECKYKSFMSVIQQHKILLIPSFVFLVCFLVTLKTVL